MWGTDLKRKDWEHQQQQCSIVQTTVSSYTHTHTNIAIAQGCLLLREMRWERDFSLSLSSPLSIPPSLAPSPALPRNPVIRRWKFVWALPAASSRADSVTLEWLTAGRLRDTGAVWLPSDRRRPPNKCCSLCLIGRLEAGPCDLPGFCSNNCNSQHASLSRKRTIVAACCLCQR